MFRVVHLLVSRMALELRENANEHALMTMIDDVDNLCKEFDGFVADINGYLHLELSVRKLLDELESSAIDYAKNEVMLLTRLQESLVKLNGECEKALHSPEVPIRLKMLRGEIQKLFAQSSNSSSRERQSGLRRVSSRRPVDIEPSLDEVAERTKTPSDEARRPGHDEERSDEVVEVSERALRKFQQLLKHPQYQKGEKATTSSSGDTKATKTNEPSSGNPKTEERSQRIWVEEDSAPTPPTVNRIRITAPISTMGMPRETTKSSEENATLTSTVSQYRGPGPENQRDLVGVEEEPTITSQNPAPTPCTMTVKPLLIECEAELVWGQAAKSFLLAVCVALPLLLLAVLFVHDWNGQWTGAGHRLGAFTFLWRLMCSVANSFCENYGTICTQYCSSGLQREKWKFCH